MSKWKYLKGSEKDFEGAPEWATHLLVCGIGEFEPGDKSNLSWGTGVEIGCRFYPLDEGAQSDISKTGCIQKPEQWMSIAQREPITSVTVNISTPCGEDDLNECTGAPESHNKYLREIKPGVWVDVYDVLSAWGVLNPALQHLIKKALQTGERGHKTRGQDLQDIIDSAIRAKELEQK